MRRVFRRRAGVFVGDWCGLGASALLSVFVCAGMTALPMERAMAGGGAQVTAADAAGVVVDEPESESVVMRRTIERRLLTARRSVDAFERALARLDRGDDPKDVRSDLAREVAPELVRGMGDRAGGDRVGAGRREGGRAGGEGGAGLQPPPPMPGGVGGAGDRPLRGPRAGGVGGLVGEDGEVVGVDVPGGVNEEEREIIFRILFTTVPPLETQLREMCELHPEQCAEQMVNLRDRFSTLIRDAREDRVLFELRLEEIRVARERFLIAREIVAYERAADDRRDEVVLQKLEHSRRHHRDLIAEQFQLRGQIRSHELSQLEDRLSELAEKKDRLLRDIESESTNREGIIEEQEEKSLNEIRNRMRHGGGGGAGAGGGGGGGSGGGAPPPAPGRRPGEQQRGGARGGE